MRTTPEGINYKQAIEWIALNDDPGAEYALDPEEVKGMVTVLLVADIAHVTPEKVAADVVAFRVRRMQK